MYYSFDDMLEWGVLSMEGPPVDAFGTTKKLEVLDLN